jgi:hypothetical protein
MDSVKQSWLGHLVQFVGVMVVIVAATVWIQESLHRIDTRLVALETHVQDRWSRTDMRIWAKDLELKNDAIVVPVVRPSLLYLQRMEPPR